MRVSALFLLLFAPATAFAQEGGCAGAISRYRTVTQSDYATGNVAASVHAQIAREIAAAEKVCSAGDDAKATAMVRASESRHGYPTRI